VKAANWRGSLTPRRVLTIVSALVVAAAAAVAVASARHESTGASIVGSIPVGDYPGKPAIGYGSVWVASGAGGEVFRIDPETNTVLARIHALPPGYGPFVGGMRATVVTGAGSVWAVNSDSARLIRIDPKTNRITARITLPHFPELITATDEAVWVYGGNKLMRIDPARNSVGAEIPVSLVYGLTSSNGHVLVVEGYPPLLLVIEPGPKTRFSKSWPKADGDASEVKNEYMLMAESSESSNVAAEGNLLWGIVNDGVIAMDLKKGRLAANLELNDFLPTDIAASPGRVWLTSSRELIAIDTRRRRVVERLSLPVNHDRPFAHVIAGSGAVWVTLDGIPSIFRVEPLES
jgi:streptogramin lyase